jgi:two-component system, LytTR family, response regulator AlgR
MTKEERAPTRILIADDEGLARRRLRTLLEECQETFPNQVAAEAGTGDEAVLAATESGANLALLDIHMPGMDGLVAARHMARLPTAPAIIFLTAYDQHAIEAFEIGAVDYLLKPVRLERLSLALTRAQRLSPEQDRQIRAQGAVRRQLTVSDRGRVLLVPLGDVLFLRAEEKYVVAQTAQRGYLLTESLAALEEEFDQQFLRIHRGCLVSRRHLAGFEQVGRETGNWQAVVRGWPDRLPVSRRQNHVVRAMRKA